MLSIRGLSDIVGFKRQDAWTKYACASAAAFTRAYLRTQPVPIRQSNAETDPAPALRGRDIAKEVSHKDTEEEEGFSNLIPLRHFPETLYVAPALSKTIKQSWAWLNQGADKSAARVSAICTALSIPNARG